MESPKLPVKRSTLTKWVNVYKDRINGDSTSEIADKFGLKRGTVRDIVRYMAKYNDLGLEGKEEIQIAKDRCFKRIAKLRMLCSDVESSYRLTEKEKHGTMLAYLKEIRVNEEMIYKLDGLLKADIKNIHDNRKVTIVHNMGDSSGDKSKLRAAAEPDIPA
jgi:hypothetical protein